MGNQQQSKVESKTSHPKLWELSSEITNLEAAIADIQDNNELDDESKENLMAQLFEEWLTLGEDFDAKACQVAHYIKNLEALTEARRNEYRRIRELAEQSNKQAERIRNYLVSQMERTGKKQIQGATANLSLRKKPAKVILKCDPELLPDDLKKVEVTPRLSAIKDYLKANPDCDFAALSTTEEYSITIK
ncbi:MAG: siphovirus Gp157 family protein [Snowella sp.]|nr:siphovirus Gp157 family protein [Snowella sp.]